MTILMIACSQRAYRLMQELEQKWKQEDPDSTILCKVKCSALAEISEKESLTTLVGEWFFKADGIVFVCAAGIAVRSIAPFLRHKSEDPAVVVLDETGTFSISLLSGHAGGANELAKRIAALVGAVPVITTATDREHAFAVDEFARKNHLHLTDWGLAKRISARILAGERIGICSELLLQGKLPEALFIRETVSPDDMQSGRDQAWIWISPRRKNDGFKDRSAESLQLIPKVIAVGIGCRKGTKAEHIARAVDTCLKEEGICPEAVFAVASIDLKKHERGLSDFCERRGLPFVTYSAEALQGLTGDFSRSAFVEEVTGVPCVCERSAVMAAQGTLLCGKKIYDGVTVALAEKKGSVRF